MNFFKINLKIIFFLIYIKQLVNSGSDAVDLAAQLARIYTGRPEIFALHKAYHGL